MPEERIDFVAVFGQLAIRIAPHQDLPLRDREEAAGKPCELWVYLWCSDRWVPLRPASHRDSLDFLQYRISAEAAAIFHLIDKAHRNS